MKNLLIAITLIFTACAKPLKLTDEDKFPLEPIREKVEFSTTFTPNATRADLYDATQRYIVGLFVSPKTVRMYENPTTGRIYLHWSSYDYFNKQDGYINYSVYFDITDNKATVTISDICYENRPFINCKSIERYLIDGKIERPLKLGNSKEYNTRVYLRKKIAKEVRNFTLGYEKLLKSKFSK